MYTIKDIKCTIYKKVELYEDWRDWFIIDKKPPENIYETLLEIYLDGYKIHQLMIPINMKTLHMIFELTSNKDTTVKVLRYFIREMCLIKDITFNNKIYKDDNITMTAEFDFLN